MSYHKKIKITDTGMIVAEVFCNDGRRVGLEFFNMSAIFATTARIENKAKKAHKWADEYVSMCERQEFGYGENNNG